MNATYGLRGTTKDPGNLNSSLLGNKSKTQINNDTIMLDT